MEIQKKQNNKFDINKAGAVKSCLCPYYNKQGIICTAPNTQCSHWQGIFCEMEEIEEEQMIQGGNNEQT